MTDTTKPPKEMQIIGVNIADWRFDPAPQQHRARVQFLYDLSNGAETGTTDCICQSDLPSDAAPDLVRDALIENAMGQLRRMPEMWLGEANLTLRVEPDGITLKPLH